MIHYFPITLAHIAPIYQWQTLLVRLSKVRIFPNAIVHKKNNTLLGTFTDQIPFQGKDDNSSSLNLFIKRPESNFTFPLRHRLFLSIPSLRNPRINELKERANNIHLPIMKGPVKSQVPSSNSLPVHLVESLIHQK